MKNVLYYVVEKQLQEIDANVGIEETTGWKNIVVYEMVDNQPKIFCEIEALNSSSSKNEIQTYLDNNGYGDKEFKFIRLHM